MRDLFQEIQTSLFISEMSYNCLETESTHWMHEVIITAVNN